MTLSKLIMATFVVFISAACVNVQTKEEKRGLVIVNDEEINEPAKQSNHQVPILTNKLQFKIKDHTAQSTAYLIYANINLENHFQLVKTTTKTSGVKMPLKAFLDSIGQTQLEKLDKKYKKYKKLRINQLNQLAGLTQKEHEQQQNKLYTMIHYYREILTHKIYSNEKNIRELSQKLYNFLIAPRSLSENTSLQKIRLLKIEAG